MSKSEADSHSKGGHPSVAAGLVAPQQQPDRARAGPAQPHDPEPLLAAHLRRGARGLSRVRCAHAGDRFDLILSRLHMARNRPASATG